MIYEYDSTRHMPKHLKEAKRLLALARRERYWQVHNRALVRGLKILWQEAGLGPWPGRAALEAGLVQLPRRVDPEAEDVGEGLGELRP